MSPLLQEGDYVVTQRRPPRNGELVVFEHPHTPAFHLVKRVIAVAGQRVEISNGSVMVDGTPEDAALTVEDTEPPGDWQIPSGHVFVLGDARHRSTDDSRTLGSIFVGEKADIVVFRYWPFGRIGRL